MGRHAITEVAQGFMTAFPDMTVLMDDLFIEADKTQGHSTRATRTCSMHRR